MFSCYPFLQYVFVYLYFFCSIWDWETGTRLNHFLNGNQPHTRITAMEILNAHDLSLLLTGSGKYLLFGTGSEWLLFHLVLKQWLYFIPTITIVLQQWFYCITTMYLLHYNNDSIVLQLG